MPGEVTSEALAAALEEAQVHITRAVTEVISTAPAVIAMRGVLRLAKTEDPDLLARLGGVHVDALLATCDALELCRRQIETVTKLAREALDEEKEAARDGG